MLGQPNSEQHRFRLGILFLVIGLILVLWAWGSWVFRMSVPQEPDRAARESRALEMGPPIGAAIGPFSESKASGGVGQAEQAVSLVSMSSMIILLLLILLLFGTLAVVIGGQRWRAMAERKRAAPTPNEDAWAMQKPPECW